MLLALDFGGTKHAAAVITAGENEVCAHRRALSPPDASDLKIMRSLIHELLQEEQPAAVGQLWWSRECLHRSCAIVASHPWLGELH